jgi:hypothetical protein
MSDAIETGAFFVVRFYSELGRFGDVGMGKHHVFSITIAPSPAWLQQRLQAAGVRGLGIFHERDRATPDPSDSISSDEPDQ